jgi:hypothetical protein
MSGQMIEEIDTFETPDYQFTLYRRAHYHKPYVIQESVRTSGWTRVHPRYTRAILCWVTRSTEEYADEDVARQAFELHRRNHLG